ncbi:FAD-dependent monooxygenase [Caballeronia sp. GAWG1-1]|uniref:FAD-dependent monooxygenase n=1 Tax=Caballeronia sp. GAWG1-1 TaxID=2921742 RepID=UPI0020292DC2|nr:FAD-dependent monooxygenase [Caballeronia sp. GAWG1-1]
MPDTIDVLIAGAGPVGLLLATELRRDGIEARVIDARANRAFFVKALGVTARTLEVFDDLGVAREAIDAGVWLTGADTFKDGTLAFSVEVPREGLPYGALSLAQYETERILEAAFARMGGHVHYGTTLIDFDDTGDSVLARMQDADGTMREIRCRWLVGCDGARSTVRHHLDVPFEGGQYPQTFMLADLDVDWHVQRGPMLRFNLSAVEGVRGATTIAALPVRGSARRYRLSMILGDDDAARLVNETAPAFADVERIMLPLLPPGTRLSSMRWSSVYRVSHRIAQKYTSGRVFIAGDAAHIHPPVGGQGMNTGLQDAHNLAWKLALVARGIANETLLSSYEAERRPVGLDVVEATSRALNTVLVHGEVRPAMRETQLLVGYRGSAIVADANDEINAQIAPGLPAPGDRVPECGGLAEAFVGHAVRLRDHIGRGRHTLIGYLDHDINGDSREPFDAAFQAWRNMLGDAGNAVLITAGKSPECSETYAVLADEAGEFAAFFGARSGMIWALRPDGHIGFRGASATTLESWLTTMLGSPQRA